MPIYNRYYIDAQSKNPSQPHLKRVGARLNIEIHITQIIADELTRKGIPLPPPLNGIGLIDTGASITAVDKEVISQLGIPPVGISEVLTPSGSAKQNIYPVSVAFPGTDLPKFPQVYALGSELKTQNIIALIGRDILEHCVFIFNGKAATITIAL